MTFHNSEPAKLVRGDYRAEDLSRIEAAFDESHPDLRSSAVRTLTASGGISVIPIGHLITTCACPLADRTRDFSDGMESRDVLLSRMGDEAQ